MTVKELVRAFDGMLRTDAADTKQLVLLGVPSDDVLNRISDRTTKNIVHYQAQGEFGALAVGQKLLRVKLTFDVLEQGEVKEGVAFAWQPEA